MLEKISEIYLYSPSTSFNFMVKISHTIKGGMYKGRCLNGANHCMFYPICMYVYMYYIYYILCIH